MQSDRNKRTGQEEAGCLVGIEEQYHRLAHPPSNDEGESMGIQKSETTRAGTMSTE
jgi:hypothetical protein